MSEDTNVAVPGTGPPGAGAGVLQKAVGDHIAQAGPGGTAMVISYTYVPPQPVDAATSLAATRRFGDLPIEGVPEAGPLPPGSRMPLSPNPLFVGRSGELVELAAALAGGARVVALSGLGGLGKTQLACEFAHRYGRWFAGGVFWLTFDKPSGIPAEIASCGGPGGLQLRPDFTTLSMEDQVRLVLAAWQSELPRLLVFDNCDDDGLLAAWRPPTGGCRVLVTSRRDEWDPVLGVRPLRLGVLRRGESVKLVRGTRDDLTDEDTDLHAIAMELGDLPLALHLAGSFLTRYRAVLRPSAYLAQLRQSDDLLAHASLRSAGISPTRHGQNVVKTFGITYARLDPADPVDALALSLLGSAAIMAPGESVPRTLLTAIAGAAPDDLDATMRVEDALRRLLELGLVEGEPGGIRLHRLLASFVRARPGADDVRETVEDALVQIFARLQENEDLPEEAPLLPHLRAVTDAAAAARTDFNVASLCNTLGSHLRRSGDVGGAIPYFEASLAVIESLLGKGHPMTARPTNDLGQALMQNGDLLRARTHLESAVPLWQRLGDDANLAATLDNLGQLAQAEGDMVEARRFFSEALDIRQRVLGPAHPRTSISMNNLGRLLLELGDLDEARTYLEQALRMRLRELGQDHLFSAIGWKNLGDLYLTLGDLPAAQECMERALPVFERRRGRNHPSVLSVLSVLHVIALDRDDRVRAEELRRRSESIQRTLAGHSLSAASTTLNNIGYSFWVRGDYTMAERRYSDALALEEQAQGPFSPALATTLNNLGMIEERKGDYAGAAGLYERALAIQERAGRYGHELTGRILNNRGVTLRRLGCLTEARACLEAALAVRSKALGRGHVNIGVTLINLGAVRHDQGEAEQGRALVEEGLGICLRRGGDSHVTVARGYHELGCLLLAEGDTEAARECLTRALAIRRQVLATGHCDVGETLVELGSLALRTRDEAEAGRRLTEALAIFDSCLGPDSPRTCDARDRLAPLARD
ncbi:tetratricopeptide repeat protein [Streptosporangium sp. G11]|uniref:tetratricopeptide repeat protein n=1 Tax=Streptosporangium sp. G11 TaxID=3436926 RepID=UPI003EB7BDA9